MVEAVMFWNEPNNLSHWNFEIDRDWRIYAEMVNLAADAVRAENARCGACWAASRPSIRISFARCASTAFEPRGCGGGARLPARLESLDHPRMAGQATRNSGGDRSSGVGLGGRRLHVSAPKRCRISGCAAALNCSSAKRSASTGTACSICRGHGRPPPATARPKGPPTIATSTWAWCARTALPKRRSRASARYTPELGICQWFHFEDHRLDDAVRRLKELGVRCVRTGVSWADSFRPNAEAWFDRQMRALEQLRYHHHVLLHARAPRLGAQPYQPAQGYPRIRRFLRPDDAAVRGIGRNGPGWQATKKVCPTGLPRD